jgi:hypothetical protein
MRGHWVRHYGHNRSRVDADELVEVTSDDDLEASYPGHDWRSRTNAWLKAVRRFAVAREEGFWHPGARHIGAR